MRDHSDSHTGFFKGYREFTGNLKAYDVKPTFVWIRPEQDIDEDHPGNVEFGYPAHREKTISFSQVSQVIAAKYEATLTPDSE